MKELTRLIVIIVVGITTTAFAHLGDTLEQEEKHLGPSAPTTFYMGDDGTTSSTFHHQGWKVVIRFQNNRAVLENWSKESTVDGNPFCGDGHDFLEVEIEPLVELYGFVYDGLFDGHLYWHKGDYWMDAGMNVDLHGYGQTTKWGWISVLTIGDSRYQDSGKTQHQQSAPEFN
jgi:hypothetical protein